MSSRGMFQALSLCGCTAGTSDRDQAASTAEAVAVTTAEAVAVAVDANGAVLTFDVAGRLIRLAPTRG